MYVVSGLMPKESSEGHEVMPLASPLDLWDDLTLARHCKFSVGSLLDGAHLRSGLHLLPSNHPAPQSACFIKNKSVYWNRKTITYL